MFPVPQWWARQNKREADEAIILGTYHANLQGQCYDQGLLLLIMLRYSNVFCFLVLFIFHYYFVEWSRFVCFYLACEKLEIFFKMINKWTCCRAHTWELWSCFSLSICHLFTSHVFAVFSGKCLSLRAPITWKHSWLSFSVHFIFKH